jgi:hypothetical protein
MTTLATLRRICFAAAMVTALGFGGAQALAAPASDAPAARRCQPDTCERRCQREFGAPGFCDGRGCRCLV